MEANEQTLILVNENDEQTGTMEKLEAHRKALLHRAFSVFIFNSGSEMLLQRRAMGKYHSEGLWTNACCSHPRPREELVQSAIRRLREEMGITTDLKEIFQFTYRHRFENGLTEYEYDHVILGSYDGQVFPDENEVMDYAFKKMEEIEKELLEKPEIYSVWFRIAYPLLKNWVNK
jgi:isopentenyl-diphosphate delta-isomerase